MGSQGIQSVGVETSVRKLRTFLDELMVEAGEQGQVPAVSRRIRQTRERLHAEWKADHPGERGNPFTQEKVAGRIGVTLGAYGSWERGRVEPDLARLRQIAVALYLDEDYFSPGGDLATATARVEAEAARLAETNDAIQELLPDLRALVEAARTAQAPGEQ